MAYKVVVTKDAEADLDEFIKYLLFEKRKNMLFSIKICNYIYLICEK